MPIEMEEPDPPIFIVAASLLVGVIMIKASQPDEGWQYVPQCVVRGKETADSVSPNLQTIHRWYNAEASCADFEVCHFVFVEERHVAAMALGMYLSV